MRRVPPLEARVPDPLAEDLPIPEQLQHARNAGSKRARYPPPTVTALLALGLSALQATAAPAPAEVAFTYHERLVFVRARMGDSERLFLLDTGASASAVDAESARELALVRGEPGEVEGTAGVIRVESATLPALALGAHAVRDLRVTVQDLSGSLRPPGMRLDGILGSDFLAGCALELDFAQRTLRLGTNPRAPSPQATVLALELENRIPRFAARLDDLSVWLRLDTGASLFETRDVYVNVPTPEWDALRAADPGLAPESHLSGTGAGGTVELAVARLQALVLGPTTIARPYVIVQPPRGYFARADAVGFVGNNLLERFGRVTIDYAGRRLVLGP